MKSIKFALSAAEWTAESYSRLNPDLQDMDSDELLAHFLRHGVVEGRIFKSPANTCHLERAVLSDRFLLVYGWAESEFDKATYIGCNDWQSPTTNAVVLSGAVLNYWRDDVAAHLGVAPRTTRHGFLAIFTLAPDTPIDSNEFVFVAGGVAQRMATPKKPRIAMDCLIEAYRNIEASMVYDEILYVLTKSPDFLREIGLLHASVMSEVAMELVYDSDIDSTPRRSICAVALGNSAQLKVWLMELVRGVDLSGVELNILANGPAEFENIRSAARWFGRVVGAQVRLFYCDRNIGFNHAVNGLISRSRGKYSLVTNTDVRYKVLDFPQLESIADQGDLAVARQFNGMGALQHAGLRVEQEKKVVHGKVFSAVATSLIGRNTYSSDHGDDGGTFSSRVEFFGAAAFYAKTYLLAKLGPFDSHFLFAYHEDTDLAFRAGKSGVGLVVTGALDIVHYESSAAKVDLPKSFLIAANAARVHAQMYPDA